jgi:hypothetical protein
MLRAQSMAASLSASLEVLSRFIAMALQPGTRSPLEEKITQAIGSFAPEPPLPPARPAPSVPVPQAAAPAPTPVPVQPKPSIPIPQAAAPVSALAPVPPAPEPPPVVESSFPAEPEIVPAAVFPGGEFDINQLTPEEQELHRRANRVAKVSMQDIKMLRPEQVKQGREHKDICIRLKDDIEKAHREYDRRFKPIMDHPVDYFYRWMVEILAEGDASALGEYPYAVASKTR